MVQREVRVIQRLQSVATDTVAATRDEEASVGTVHQLPTDHEPYITLQAVAERLGFSTRWVHDRIRFDGLPHYQGKKGTPHRFRWSEVERWFKERET